MQTNHSSKFVGLLLAAVATGLTACEPAWMREGKPIGVVLFETRGVEGDERQLVTAQFLKQGKGTPRLFTKNSCGFAEGAPSSGGYIMSDRMRQMSEQNVLNATMDAGPHLVIESPSDTMRMPRTISHLSYVYGMPPSVDVGFFADAGDSVHISVPGAEAGFSAVDIDLRIASPVRMDTASASGALAAPLLLTWVPDPVPGSRVLFQAVYSVHSLAPYIQIFCEFPDTGAAVVPGEYMEHYRQYQAFHQPLTFGRYRESHVVLPGGRQMAAFSISLWPLPPLPPGA